MNVERMRELAAVLRRDGTPENFDWVAVDAPCVAGWCSRHFTGSVFNYTTPLLEILSLDQSAACLLFVGWNVSTKRDPKAAAEMLEKMADDYERGE